MEGKDSSSDGVPKPVVAQVQVLHAAMVLRILGDLDGGLVVDVERTRTDREPHLCEEIAHPESLLSRCNSRDVLCFGGGQGLDGLQAAGPADSSSTHLDNITNTELVEVSLFYREAKTMSVAVEMLCLSRVTITEIVLTITKFSNQQRSHSSVPRLIPNDRIATSSPL